MKRKNNIGIIRRTLPMFRPYRWMLVLAGITLMISGATVAGMPLFTKFVIDKAIPQKNLLLVVQVMIGFLALMAVRMGSWYIGQRILLLIREKVIFHLRTSLFRHMQELCLRFHQKYSPGFLYDRTIGGTSASVGIFLASFFMTAMNSTAGAFFAIFFCWQLSPQMTIVATCMSIMYINISRRFSRKMRSMNRDFNEESNELAGRLTDLLRGIKTIKAYTMEDWVIDEFEGRTWPLQMRSYDINIATIRLSFCIESVSYLITFVVMIMGSWMVLGKSISLGTMVAFIAYQATITNYMNSIASITASYGSALAGLDQIYEVIDEQPSVLDKPDVKMSEVIEGRVSFDEVYFSYDGRPVLNGITLDFEPGQSVALVGPSGGGKTTFINLLLRFYEADKGCIRLDGRDIRELPLSDYRSLFGVVLQDPFLFDDTVYNNLIAVKPDATDKEIREALERAHAWDFVSKLKDDWNFRVGESGSQLSGGQRQRIALARCILINPRILVLDEATSALDNQSEALIQDELEEMMKDRTVFVIAHRLSTVRNVDRVLVLQDGHIIQDGTYDELSNTQGMFHELQELSRR